MKLSDQGLKFIAHYETVDGEPNLKAIKSTETYKDGRTKYEIGWGHTSDMFFTVNKNTEITYADAVDLLKHDVIEAENLTRGFIHKNRLKLEQCQFDALVSLAYNGVPFYAAHTGLYKALVSGDEEAIRREWMRWTKATIKGKKKELKGLVLRRKDELELYFNGEYNRDYEI